MEKKWHKLDNVGKYYSSIAFKSTQKIFRYSVTLKRYVKKEVLQSALNETMKYYRHFNVHLKQGLFWYYTLEDKEVAKVKKEDLPICYKLYDNSDDLLYRVTYYRKRINFELSHIISDGLGSLEFFKLLVNNYINIRYNLKIKELNNKVSSKELEEDSFVKNYIKNNKGTKVYRNIYEYKGKKYKNGIQYLEAHLSLKEVIDLAHEYNTSLTVFLTSLLIYSFKPCLKGLDIRKNIKIDIPVNLRNYYPSNSSKNYFALVSVVYKFKKNDTIRNVIYSVEEQLKKVLSKEEIFIRVNKMVAFEKNPFCRISPLFLKNIFLKITNQFVISMSSTCLSNVGKIEFNEKVNKYIENVNVITNTPNFQLTVCSFNDDLSINISNIFKNNMVIKNFIRFFTKNDMKVIVNANGVRK